jgi:hypothetical protein
MLKRIHVNRHHIAANKKDGGNRPIYTVKTHQRNYKGHSVRVDGALDFVDGQAKPLNCGAVAWGETRAPVYVDDELIA